MPSNPPKPFTISGALWAALRSLSADRSWPLKVLAGGACITSLIGLPLAQGYLLEHIELARKGIATPLPRWDRWGAKYLAGLLALMIDFAYFVLPQLLLGALTLCIGAVLIAGAGTLNLGSIALIMAALFAAGFLLGLSPIGKQELVEESDLAQLLDRQALQAALHGPHRRLYARARLATLPAYLPALGIGVAIWFILKSVEQTLAVLAAAWCLNSAIFFAHLVVAQVYSSAAALAQRIDFEARVAQYQKGRQP